jgi:hypothetical protein
MRSRVGSAWRRQRSADVEAARKRLAAAGLDWPLPADMTDPVLEGRLFTPAGKKQGHRRRTAPDWAAVHRELKRKHVTLQILWDELHRAKSRWLPLLAVLRAVPRLGLAPLGHDAAASCRGRQALCRLGRRHGTGDRRPADRQDPAGVGLRRRVGRFQLHLRRGELDPGARRLDRRPHTRAFETIGGAPNLLVPDNTKVAVIKACLYEPQVNRTYAEMAAHIFTAWPNSIRQSASFCSSSTRSGPIRRLGITRRAMPREHRSWVLRRIAWARIGLVLDLARGRHHRLLASKGPLVLGSASSSARLGWPRPAIFYSSLN